MQHLKNHEWLLLVGHQKVSELDVLAKYYLYSSLNIWQSCRKSKRYKVLTLIFFKWRALISCSVSSEMKYQSCELFKKNQIKLLILKNKQHETKRCKSTTIYLVNDCCWWSTGVNNCMTSVGATANLISLDANNFGTFGVQYPSGQTR